MELNYKHITYIIIQLIIKASGKMDYHMDMVNWFMMMGQFIKAALNRVMPNVNKHFISLVKEHSIEAKFLITRPTVRDNYIPLDSIIKAFGKMIYLMAKADKFTHNILIFKVISI